MTDDTTWYFHDTKIRGKTLPERMKGTIYTADDEVQIDEFCSIITDNENSSKWETIVTFRLSLCNFGKVNIGDVVYIERPDYPPAFYKIERLCGDLKVEARHDFNVIGYHTPTLNMVLFEGDFQVQVGDFVMVGNKTHRIIGFEEYNNSIQIKEV